MRILFIVLLSLAVLAPRAEERVPMREEEVDTEGRIFADARGPAPVGILVEPSGRRAFIANTNADVVTVLDLASYEVVSRLHAGREPDGMAWIPAPPSGGSPAEAPARPASGAR